MKPSPTLRNVIDALCDSYESSDEGNVAVVDLAVLVAMADGTIDKAEMESLAASLEAVVGARLSPVLTRHLVAESRDQIEERGAEARAHAIGESLAAHNVVDEGLKLGLTIALASDGLSDIERAMLALVAKGAGVDAAHLDTLLAKGPDAASE